MLAELFPDPRQLLALLLAGLHAGLRGGRVGELREGVAPVPAAGVPGQVDAHDLAEGAERPADVGLVDLLAEALRVNHPLGRGAQRLGTHQRLELGPLDPLDHVPLPVEFQDLALFERAGEGLQPLVRRGLEVREQAANAAELREHGQPDEALAVQLYLVAHKRVALEVRVAEVKLDLFSEQLEQVLRRVGVQALEEVEQKFAVDERRAGDGLRTGALDFHL